VVCGGHGRAPGSRLGWRLARRRARLLLDDHCHDQRCPAVPAHRRFGVSEGFGQAKTLMNARILMLWLALPLEMRGSGKVSTPLLRMHAEYL
jgi:hypothetical protein